MTADASNDRRLPEFKIQVTGEVRLGDELSLKTSLPSNKVPHLVVVADNSVLPPHKRTPVRRPSRDVNVRLDVGYALEEDGGSVAFRDQGLCLQYGILGGPGSGKTNALLYLLRQIIGHCAHKSDRQTFNPNRKFGALILDPKAALIDDLRLICRQCDRKDDLVVINTRELHKCGGINVIDCMLSPLDLAKALVLAAQSAGQDPSESFWSDEMIGVFGAVIGLLKFNFERAPTVNDLLIYTTGVEADIPENEAEGADTRAARSRHARANAGWGPALEVLVNATEKRLGPNPALAGHSPGALHDLRLQLGVLKRFVRPDADSKKNRKILEQFMEQAFGLFRLSENLCYSREAPSIGESLYDQIINDGKIVLVSPGTKELKLAAVLPTLVKLIFQRTLLSRFDRYLAWQIVNAERPVLFMADEYHTVATQLKGEPTGDSEFFSLARQFGGLCIVATQTVEQLQTSRLGDNWKAVFGTLAAVIGMKGDDIATMEYLQKRAGNKDVQETTKGYQSEPGKVTTSENNQRISVPRVPFDALKLFRSGDAVVIGTTTGHGDPASVRYARVPRMASTRLEVFVDEAVRLWKERGYDPPVFPGMRRQYGTLQAIEKLVQSDEFQSGFERLKQLGLLECSIEAVVTKFPAEFTRSALECARRRLRPESRDSN